MLHEIGAGRVTAARGRTLLGARERAALLAIARAAMPEGRWFAGADTRAVEKVDALPGALAAVGGARLSRDAAGARRLGAGPPSRAAGRRCRPTTVLQLLERWRVGDVARRTMVRMLTAPLKIAHYNDPQMYSEVGCRYGSLPVRAESPRWMQERVVPAAALDGDDTLECDVVVIGTGAGGAVVAKELAEPGHAVVLLEEGDYNTRADFTGHAADMQRKLYRDMGATLSLGNAVIPIPLGRTVGGTTAINSGTCYRTPDRVLARVGARASGSTSWRPASMAPLLRARRVGAGRRAGRRRSTSAASRASSRAAATRSATRTSRCAATRPSATARASAASAARPTPSARPTSATCRWRSRPAPTLFTGLRAERVLVDGGRAVGVVARGRTPDGAKRTLTVRARAIVVACGSLLTPLLLEASGIGTVVGTARAQPVDPSRARRCMALFDEKLDGGNAIPQGYAIEHFHDEGILFEGAFAAARPRRGVVHHDRPALRRAARVATIASPASAS